MRTSNRLLAGAVALALTGGAVATLAPAMGQDRPESILPPGFGDPNPQPTPRPTATRAASDPATAVVQPLPVEMATPSPTPTATPSPTPTVDPAMLAEYEMPSFARRSTALVGPVVESEGGLRADAFGRADGRYLEELMRRTAAPLPSRWLSILLRRTLVSQLGTPAHVNGADFAAERAWLLLRMGESVAARAVVQGVDRWNYTPKLYQVAMNAALATGDPSGLCPLADEGLAATGERGWTVAQAMCAALTGEGRARALLQNIRRRRIANGIDLKLAQKVIGAGPRGGQSITIDWAGVDRLTPWRFGLATATGVTVTPDMLSTAGPQVVSWQALSPAVPLGGRTAAAESAAAQGVLSNAALVDFYAAIDADDDAAAPAASVAQNLATAYTDPSADARMAAIRQIWSEASANAYARTVLTARAATRIPAAGGNADADRLVAAMLSAGLDRAATRWSGAVATGGDGWAMIALANPDAQSRVGYSDMTGYTGAGDATLKRRMFFAGLAGLGRLPAGDVERGAQALSVRIGAENAWTRALDRAARADQPGTVVLLAAIGMQTNGWRGVPPEALYRIVVALRSVGLEGEARMIAAEAIAQL